VTLQRRRAPGGALDGSRRSEIKERISRGTAEVLQGALESAVGHERDMLAGSLRASDVIEADPGHEGAKKALKTVLSVEPADLAVSVHRDTFAAVKDLLGEAGYVSPTALRDELRKRERWEALRLLPDLVAGVAFAPVASMADTVRRIKDRAEQRRTYAEAQDTQAEIVSELAGSEAR
jgi:hypothetical protein